MKLLLLLCLSFLLTIVLSAQNRFDIVIDEIMADPSPQVGLPSNEWIELKTQHQSLSIYKAGVLQMLADKAAPCPILFYSLIVLLSFVPVVQ